MVVDRLQEKDIMTSSFAFLNSRLNSFANITELFERLWVGKEVGEIFYENLLRPNIDIYKSQIIALSNNIWEDLIQALRKDPREIYKMNPRKFEELVAELLHRKGFSVKLTPLVKDGGYDIFAAINSPLGDKLVYLVECKRYSLNRPVGLNIVRALYGTVTKERASKGLLVTTSTFTKGALKMGDELKCHMTLNDYSDLRQWIDTL